MSANANLHKAKDAKNDEFYTLYENIEKELQHYTEHFNNKVVYCNCDDPKQSNFWKYFKDNFNKLGLKSLVSTYYTGFTGDVAYKTVYNGCNELGIPLQGNGDFQSDECIEILQQSDIVVTNPPFSLFREYITTLVGYEKNFLIVGNLNSITYREIMPLIKTQFVRVGKNAGHYWFRVPDWYEEKTTDFKIDENGQKWRRMGNVCWFTNMGISAHHERLVLHATYSPENYRNCMNMDAIFVKSVSEIPCDYDGMMAVPITILTKFNSEQFELLGFDKDLTNDHGRVRTLQSDGSEKIEYARLIIRQKV